MAGLRAGVLLGGGLMLWMVTNGPLVPYREALFDHSAPQLVLVLGGDVDRERMGAKLARQLQLGAQLLELHHDEAQLLPRLHQHHYHHQHQQQQRNQPLHHHHDYHHHVHDHQTTTNDQHHTQTTSTVS